MSDKLRRTHTQNITFADGEAPTGAKLTAVAKQARVGARVLENAVGDLWNQSGDSLLNDWPLQIPNLARLVGESKNLNPPLYATTSSFSYVDYVGSKTAGYTQGYLQFKPTSQSVVTAVANSPSLTDKKTDELDVVDAGDWWVDGSNGRWRTFTPVTTGDLFEYTVDPTEWVADDQTLPNIIPDVRQLTFTGCRVSTTGGKFYLHLPPRRPLDLSGTDRPERYPSTVDITYNEATSATGTVRLWQSSAVDALAAAHSRYRLPKEISDVITSLGSGTTLPAGFMYLWDQSKRTIIEDIVFRTSSQGNWVFEISSLTEDFTSKVSSLDTQAAYNSTSYSIITVGSSVTRLLHMLMTSFYSGQHDNSGDFSPLIPHSALTGLNPPPYDASLFPAYPSDVPPWPASNWNNDDHTYLLSRAGSHGAVSYPVEDGSAKRDINDNAMLGDLVLASNVEVDGNRLNISTAAGTNGRQGSMRIYFGKRDDLTAPNMYAFGAAMRLYGSSFSFDAVQGSIDPAGISVSATDSSVYSTYMTAGNTLSVGSVSNDQAYGLILYAKVAAPVFAPLHITPQNNAPTGPNAVGDIYVTSAGILKICTVAGTPGTWASVGAQS